jgi:hypothetical protein
MAQVQIGDGVRLTGAGTRLDEFDTGKLKRQNYRRIKCLYSRWVDPARGR